MLERFGFFMFGSLEGNVMGICFFLAFQILGIFLSCMVFRKEKAAITVLLGSVMGSFMVQWIPVLYAFLFDFTVLSHVLALITVLFGVMCACFVLYKTKKDIFYHEVFSKKKFMINRQVLGDALKDNPALLIIIPLFIYVVIVLFHHTISYNGISFHTGQSTYGDMNMHLGFITSIANQKNFPPDYSILPGTKLAYPFLSDSISSSVYIWGTSLKIAYMLPMIFALLQVFFSMYALAKYIFVKLGSAYRGKSFLAFVLFFFNGGLGFLYFINKGFISENFTRIFTEFYQTPTNYVDENIQWHNIICDMLIPQRATLFGWAILFPVFLILFKAVLENKSTYFITGGVLAGGLVLIHTHSFLALGILCAGFMTIDMLNEVQKNKEKRWKVWQRLLIVLCYLVVMSFISIKQLSDTPFSAEVLMGMGFAIIGAFLGIFFYYLKGSLSVSKRVFQTWGVFLLIVLIVAVPQLFGFTFKQAQGEHFVRGVFNWANKSDAYIWFYIKNLGILYLITIAIAVVGTKRQIQLVLPSVFLWFIAEFIVFQPNTYDNNKLLLVAYLFLCIAASDFVWDTVPSWCQKYASGIRKAAVAVVSVVAVFAAVLTMGREYVSDYELYNRSYTELAEWVENNTKPQDVFLTATNHNNAVASLTGRNIVCGSGAFLYYHGIDYGQNDADVKTMYEQPDKREELLEKYHVSYIVIGDNEMGSYVISDLQSMLDKYEVVFSAENLVVLKV